MSDSTPWPRNPDLLPHLEGKHPEQGAWPRTNLPVLHYLAHLAGDASHTHYVVGTSDES